MVILKIKYIKSEVKCYFNWSGMLYDGAYAYFTVSKSGATMTMISAVEDTVIYTFTLPPRR